MRTTEQYLDGLQLLYPSLSPGIYAGDPEGIDYPINDTAFEDNSGARGGAVTNQRYSGRVITIPGTIRSTSASTYETLRRQMLSVVKNQTDAFGYPVLHVYRFKTKGGGEYWTYGAVESYRCPFEQAAHSDFMINLRCPDPMLYGPTLRSSGLITRPVAGGLLFPRSDPWLWGGASGGSAMVVNAGDGETYPVLTINGVFTNVSITNQTTGISMTLNYTSGANDVIVIDTNPNRQSIIRNGTDPLITALSATSDFLWLASGTNALTVTSNDTGDTGTVQVQWYDAYIGA